MKKRVTSFLLGFCMCVALIPVSAQATETPAATPPEIPTEGDVWDGSITQPTKLVQKDGVYYYEITKCSELAYVAQTGGEWLGYNYILGNDLILNDVELTWDEDGACTNEENLLEWTPISGFSGTLDGDQFSISGVYIDQPDASYQRTGFFASLRGNVYNLHLSNIYVSGKTYVGGIAGEIGNSGSKIRNCSVRGLIKGSEYVGGVAGYCSLVQLDGLTNYAQILGKGNYTAGIVGYGLTDDLTNCVNYGSVSGHNYTAGIAGYPHFYTVSNCINYGSVSGSNTVGGIVSYAYGTTISQCSNFGSVLGTSLVGGILGSSENGNVLRINLSNCYNLAAISGDREVGGIAGGLFWGSISKTYSAGTVSGSSSIGGIVGKSDHIWGRSTLSRNYYIASDSYFGCGNLQEDTADQFEAMAAAELKEEITYVDWNFNNIWSISQALNSGYPYLQWQESSLSNIPANGISLSDTTLALSVGDYAYLSATVSPANASNKSVTWKSSDSDIATVSAAGKVTAVSAGTAIITATTVDGGYTATCTVTVTERLAEEYKINSITVRDNDGAALSAIPNGICLATVSITNLASEGNTLVFLAAYSPTGQYQGMMWVSVEDLPIGATVKVTLPVDNSDGKIENLKAFTVASFSNLTPLSEAVSFLT